MFVFVLIKFDCASEDYIVSRSARRYLLLSLFEARVFRFKEGLESDTHILVLILLTKLKSLVADEALLEPGIKLFLLALGHSEDIVGGNLLDTLEEVLCPLQDLFSDHVDRLVMLDQQASLESLVRWRQENDPLGELLKLEVVDGSVCLLTARVTLAILVRLLIALSSVFSFLFTNRLVHIGLSISGCLSRHLWLTIVADPN